MGLRGRWASEGGRRDQVLQGVDRCEDVRFVYRDLLVIYK